MSRKNEVQLKRDENMPPKECHVEEAAVRPARPVDASVLPLRQLNTPGTRHRLTSKDRLRQFCRRIFQDSASPPPPPPAYRESPQVINAACSEQMPGTPTMHKTGGECRALQLTPNASPRPAESPAGDRETDGATGSADTSTSSEGHFGCSPVVLHFFSPDFDKYRELFRQELREHYREYCSIHSPVTAVDDMSPGLIPSPAAAPSASDSVCDVQQIVSVPMLDSPAHYTLLAADSPKQLESSPIEFQLPGSVTWKRRRGWHGRRRSSATPPEASPGSQTGHSEASPRVEGKDSSYEADWSGSDTGRGGGGGPAANLSGFGTPDLDNFCRRVRADMAKLYISPRPSPAKSVESVGADAENHRGTRPQLSPANFVEAAAPLEVRDDWATSSSPFLSPPPLLAWAQASPVWRLAPRHRLSTVVECLEESTCSTIHGATTAVVPLLEESLLTDARQPTLVDGKFGAWMPTTVVPSELDTMVEEEELPANRMSDSLASFIEHEREINVEFGIKDSPPERRK